MPFTSHYVFDIECYPNFFSLRATRDEDGAKWCFEISQWVNQGAELNMFLHQVAQSGGRMVGYNNEGYDYPMVHLIMDYNGIVNNTILYQKSCAIIGADHNDWSHRIWDRDRYIPQVDLYKIHHFDNKAKQTSLKLLEFNMLMDSIQELPYPPGTVLTYEQSREVLAYNDHDVDATRKFHGYSKKAIAFRDKLSEKYGKDFTNHNDTRIGADFFVMELAKHGINAHKNNQTIRTEIRLADVILPYVSFESPEFNEVLDFFRKSVIDPEQIKGFFGDLSVEHKGFKFDFGAGGIHGSLHNTVIVPGQGETLRDSDVASYYPNLAISNRFYPLHLSEKFCDVYLDVYNQRKSYPKKTAENGMLKLALNGVYGKSNDKHSPFLDPQYTMAITINGQLLLCMLAEQLMKIPGLRVVQINTDGLTYVCPNEYLAHTDVINDWWEKLTKLELEHVNYLKMAIRDVNSYLAVTEPYIDKEGALKPPMIKRIGAYAYERASENDGTRELPWHKNHGGVVIAKAAEAALVYGKNIEQFVRGHLTTDPLDFMMRTKVPRSADLYLETEMTCEGVSVGTKREKLQNVSRYFVSQSGGRLIKEMTPTPDQIKNWDVKPHWRHKRTGETKMATKAPSGMWKEIQAPAGGPPMRCIGIESGCNVTVTNNLTGLDVTDLDIDYYVKQAKKLVNPLIS